MCVFGRGVEVVFSAKGHLSGADDSVHVCALGCMCLCPFTFGLTACHLGCLHNRVVCVCAG